MIRGLASLYSLRSPHYLFRLWERSGGVYGYLNAFWHTPVLSNVKSVPTYATANQKRRFVLGMLYVWMVLQIVLGATLCIWWYVDELMGGWQFGLAVLLSYPLVIAHVLPFAVGLWWLGHPKKLGRSVLCVILEAQVKRLRRAHDFSVVAIAGGIGKTSTKMAIARTLGASRRVQWQEGNYNDRVTIPLIFFGHDEPSIFNIPAWIKILLRNERMVRAPYPYQVVVVEFGPDGPGQIREFAYVQPDLIVITAITPEHMEFFKTMDIVAEEELSTLHFSKRALINIDDTPAQYLEGRNYQSYGLSKAADYYVSRRSAGNLQSQKATFHLGTHTLSVTLPLLGDQGAKIALAAAATAHILDIPAEDIKQGLATISAFAGRMRVFHGVSDSTLIDDTYNASPHAVKAALDVLYSGQAPQRIAILGAMNELGEYSETAHREVGEYCDPTKLDWVITIGANAKDYLAPIARQRGCRVRSFMDPYQAGRFAKKQLIEGAVVLAKGSQNGVFAEEALKLLLADHNDDSRLVRQSAYWMSYKAKQFKQQ